MIVSRKIIFIKRILSDRSCRGNRNTFYAPQLFSENGAVYDKMWKNMVEPERSQKTKQYSAFMLDN
jgi:hypothetical protein